MSHGNKMIAACKLEQTEDPFSFWRNTQEIAPAQYPNYRPRPRKPQSVHHLTPATDTQEHREHTLTFHPVTPKILKEEY